MLVTDAFHPSNDNARRELYPWVYGWTQTDDWATDADGDQGRANNCGPESLAACLKYLTGVELSADIIRDMLVTFYGASPTGYTDMAQLVSWLNRFAEVDCDRYQGDADTLLRPVIEGAIEQGFPVVVLFAWNYSQFRQTGHWMPCVAVSDSGAWFHQVWGGGRVYAPWAVVEDWQKFGTAFVLRRRRDAQLPG